MTQTTVLQRWSLYTHRETGENVLASQILTKKDKDLVHKFIPLGPGNIVLDGDYIVLYTTTFFTMFSRNFRKAYVEL